MSSSHLTHCCHLPFTPSGRLSLSSRVFRMLPALLWDLARTWHHPDKWVFPHCPLSWEVESRVPPLLRFHSAPRLLLPTGNQLHHRSPLPQFYLPHPPCTLDRLPWILHLCCRNTVLNYVPALFLPPAAHFSPDRPPGLLDFLSHSLSPRLALSTFQSFSWYCRDQSLPFKLPAR